MLSLTLVLMLAGCGDTPTPTEPTTPDATEAAPAVEAPPADPTMTPADVAAPPADATTTASGLAYKVIVKGEGGDHPTATTNVVVHYTGWTTDGKKFDSSHDRKEPARFPLNGVIAGWTEGVQLMSKGDTFRFWIPEKLAYQGQPGAPAGMLVFDVQLLDFVAPPVAPADVAAAPADATVTATGLAYKVLSAGAGGAKPTGTSRVTVHYTGWTTDGQMFDSSVARGRPATFPLNGVIPGWTEGLQLLSPGDKARFWIPGKLAYDGKPGRPQGVLVFDVELISFQ